MFDQFGNDPFAMPKKREAAPVTLGWLRAAGLIDAQGVAAVLECDQPTDHFGVQTDDLLVDDCPECGATLDEDGGGEFCPDCGWNNDSEAEE